MQSLAGILYQAFAIYAHTVATFAAVLSRMYPTIAQRNSTAVLHRLLMCQRCHSICFRSEHQGHGASTRVGPLKARHIQELPVTIPELATMGPSWAPDGTEVLGSSSSSVFRVDALTGQQLRGYREAGGKLTQGKQEDSQKAASALGKHIMPVHSSNYGSHECCCSMYMSYQADPAHACICQCLQRVHMPSRAEDACR